jgi:CHAT domain-containing protein
MSTRGSSSPRMRSFASKIFGALALGALIVLVVGIVATQHRSNGEETVLARLTRERILLARISTDNRWSLCTPAGDGARAYCRTPEEISHSIEPRQLAALEPHVGADTRHLRLLADLLLRRGSDYLRNVVSQLEAETLKKSNEADLLTDLAAAQLTLGWTQNSAGSFVDALQSADRALEIKPANARTCFNRAFALEELGLRELAMEGWKHCSLLEHDPRWRDEALQRAEALRTQPPVPSRQKEAAALEQAILNGRQADLEHWARDQPQTTIEILVRNLLPKWADAGLIEKAAWWPGLEELADRIEKETKDRFLLDTVRQMRSSLAMGSGPEITEGFRRLRLGLDAYRKRQYHQAAFRLHASMSDLRSVPALQIIVRAYRAVSLHSSDQVNTARKELRLLVEEAETREYHWPLGYAHWTLGRMAIKEGRPLKALDHYLAALHAFEKNRSEELVLSDRILLAETYSSLGQSEQAWQFGRQALHEAYRIGATDRLFFVLNLLAGVADEQGRSGLALYAQTGAIEHSADEPPRSRANAYIWRAYLLGRRADYALAQADLRHAEELAPEVGDPSESVRLSEEIALAHGVLAVQVDPKAAATWLDRTIHLCERTGDRFMRLIALKARAEALHKLGRIEDALIDLKQAMAGYDAAIPDLTKEQSGAPSEKYRLTYLQQNADLYQAMVDLYVNELGAPWKALILADHANALQAPSAVPEISLQETRIDRWRQALPPETGLLVYGTAGQRIVAWVLTPTSRQFFSLGRSDELTVLIERLDRTSDIKTWEALSQEIYLRLVSPLGEPLRHVRRLLIVPNRGLDRVPFAGLLDPRSGRYLAETHLLEMLPCASALLRGGGFREGPATRRHALVVGDPEPTKAGLLGLPSLRFAEQEARQAAASLGPDTVLLLGREATPRRFREEAVAAGLIHVAGHALALGRGPDSAALILATSADDEEGLLTTRGILDLPLSETDLVVLSACSSAGGPVVSWQSGLTLARSFLSAGAERVVATLHAVDDEESAKLFEAFYREFAAGRDAAASLRSAQQSVIRWRTESRGGKPPSWPYMVILESHPSK